MPGLLPSKRKQATAVRIKRLQTLPSATHDTMAHLVGYRTMWATKPPNYCKLVKRTIQNAHRKKNAIEYSTELEGGLFLPSRNLVIASYSTNNHLYVDVHGMAKSEGDG